MTNIYSYSKALLLLVFCFASTSTKAQIPAAFPDSSASWSVQFVGYPGPYYPPWYVYYRYYLDGDTLINGKSYTRVFEAPTNAMLIDTANATYIGGLREDSTRKVWFIGEGVIYPQLSCNFPPDTIEHVLYDWNLAVGDTIYPYSSQNQPTVILWMDTININGTDRRRWQTDGGNDSYWIEGIGSTKGLFFPWCDWFEEDLNLLCYEDAEIQYSNINVTNCYIIAEVQNPVLESIVSIGPNPAAESLRIRIQAPSTERFDLQLLDLNGRLLRRATIWGGEEQVLNREGLPAGIYGYRLSSPERGHTAGKVIFQ